MPTPQPSTPSPAWVRTPPTSLGASSLFGFAGHEDIFHDQSLSPFILMEVSKLYLGIKTRNREWGQKAELGGQSCDEGTAGLHLVEVEACGHTYWNQGYGYQRGYRPGYGGSDDSPHGYYGYGPGYYYRKMFIFNSETSVYLVKASECFLDMQVVDISNLWKEKRRR
ncbi:Proline And Serine-Rich Protein 1 [Manis pentadactyla]|nr:Proline And Serine-Rich Protein 1 [Manis pentadactyla]